MTHKELCSWFHGGECDCNAELVNELLEVLENLTRWVGKGIADGMYADCVNPERAQVDLTRAEEAIRKAKSGER